MDVENENSKQEAAKDLIETLKEVLPKNIGLVKAEYEGPDIAVYVSNIEVVYDDESLVKNLSSMIKRKLIIRSDPSKLLDPEKAKEKILELIPKEAEVGNIKFVPDFGEVYIEALKPGLVIGKGGSTLKSIINETKWVPKVLRVPTMNSDVINGVRQLLLKESEFRKKFLTSVGKKISTPIMKTEWLKATALGGFREVGRSSLLTSLKQIGRAHV